MLAPNCAISGVANKSRTRTNTPLLVAAPEYVRAGIDRRAVPLYVSSTRTRRAVRPLTGGREPCQGDCMGVVEGAITRLPIRIAPSGTGSGPAASGTVRTPQPATPAEPPCGGRSDRQPGPHPLLGDWDLARCGSCSIRPMARWAVRGGHGRGSRTCCTPCGGCASVGLAPVPRPRPVRPASMRTVE